MGRNAVALVMLGAAVSASSPALVARADTPLVDAVKRHDRADVERLLTDGADIGTDIAAECPGDSVFQRFTFWKLGRRFECRDPTERISVRGLAFGMHSWLSSLRPQAMEFLHKGLPGTESGVI